MNYSTEISAGHSGGPFELTALAASNDISYLLKKNPYGHVHSVFNTSFNLAFGDHLVHFGALDNGLAPFGIGLETAHAQLLTKLLAANQKVYWDEVSSMLIFPSAIFLSLRHVKWTNHKLEPAQYQLSYLKDNFEFVAGRLLQADWQTGLAETEEEKKQIIDYLLDSLASYKEVPVLYQLNTLENLICGHEEIDAENVFHYWIGRGLGLTPSGDDVITGICSVFSVLEGSNQVFLQQLTSYLAEHGRQRTTHIALEYLLYATENKFHSHLVELLSIMDKPRGSEFLTVLEEIKKIGHTSGADTLIGVLMGIKAAAIYRERKKGDYY